MEIIRRTRRPRIMNLISCCCCCCYLALIFRHFDHVEAFNAIRSFATRSHCKDVALPVVKMAHGGYGQCTISTRPRRLEQLKQMMNWKPLSNIWIVGASSSMASEDFDYSAEKNTTKLILEAEALRSQAKAIMAQALAMEQELKESRSKARKSKVQETDKLIEQWFHVDTQLMEASDLKGPQNSNEQGYSTNRPVPATTAVNTTVVNRLIELNVTPQQVLQVVDRLFERQMAASGQTSWSRRDTTDMLVPIQNYLNETEYERLSDMLDTLTIASGILDELVNNRTMDVITTNTRWSGRVEPAVRARLNELRRTQKLELDRELIAEMNKGTKSPTGAVETHVRRNVRGQQLEQSGSTNSSSMVVVDGSEERSTLIPLWVPSSFIPFMNANPKTTLEPEQVKALNDQVLLGSRFYVTSYSSVTRAAIFRGNIRGEKTKGNNQHTAAAYADVQRRLDKIPSLRDQVQLFLLPDPEWKPNDQQDPEAKPVIFALPKDVVPDESKLKKSRILKIAKTLLYPLAVLTSFRYAIQGFSLNEFFFNAVVKERNLTVLTSRCLPVVGGIFAMQVLHEVVQYLVAKWRGIQVGPPVPVPSMALGMFGCITPIKSFPDSRAALLDFALSGPLATTMASIGCIVASVILTVRASPAVLATFPVLPALLFKSSLLVGTIISWIASKPLMLPLAQPIPIHPLFLVGYAGLISSGLNLLPIFRLDGGRACTAAMGTRQGAVISVSILLFLLSLALSGGSGLGVSWGMFVAIFQRRPEIPARDDVTEVDDFRLGAWIFSFLLSLAILSPFPGAQSIL